jgi:enolase-phosphatase E1
MPEANARAILLDIEGTTTPVTFVYEVLFPYARSHLREFLQYHDGSEDLQSDLLALKAEHRSDIEQRHEPPVWFEDSAAVEQQSAAQYVYWLMDQDRKSTALKALQGKIWKDGYLSGKLRGQVFPDVVPAFRRWKEQQRSIYIFSSGSILAQKLLFAHTNEGDLTGYLSDYFDTTTGPKTNAASYASISEKIEVPGAEILFVSDINGELDAALESGMQTALCVRQESGASENSRHQIVRTFEVIFP